MGKGRGGGYYDREVETNTGAGASQAAQRAMASQTMDPACDPKQLQSVESDAESSVVICMDITGSMGSFPKIIFDKLPMFYGQIMTQGYLDDCAMAFTFYNHPRNDLPVQISDFQRGDGIDGTLQRLALRTGGGGDEGLEFPAFYYAYRSRLPEGQKGYYFFIGDSLPTYQDTIPKHEVERLLGIPVEGDVKTQDVFDRLRQKYEVFFVCRVPTTHGAENGDIPRRMQARFTQYFGEGRTLRLRTAKAVVDIMLAAISTHSGQRTWEQYIDDMRERGQTEERIDEVHWSFGRTRGKESADAAPGVAPRAGGVKKGAAGGGGGGGGGVGVAQELTTLFLLKEAGALNDAQFRDAKAAVIAGA